MAYGNILADVSNFTVSTADGIRQELKNNFISKIAIKLLGIPHIGLRVRARLILKLLNPDKNDTILDAGCGPGICLLTLSKRIDRGYGVDIDGLKISEATRLTRELAISNIIFNVSDVTNLDFPVEFFDKIICSEVMEHVKDDKALVRGLFKILKKQGTLIISSTSLAQINQRHKDEFGHERVGYSAEQLKQLFTDSGFCIEQIFPYGLFFGQKSWRINRMFLSRKFINALCFYPLFVIAQLDNFLPYNLRSNCIGYIVKLRKE